MFLTPKKWDGGWEGRFGTILDTAPARDRPTVRSFFERFEPLSPVRGEATSGWHPWVETSLVLPLGVKQACMGVLLTRYKDNTYILFVNVPEHCLRVLRHCVFCLLRAIYGIPMKWEPEADPQKWGVAQIHIGDVGPSLTRNGAVDPSACSTPQRDQAPCTRL